MADVIAVMVEMTEQQLKWAGRKALKALVAAEHAELLARKVAQQAYRQAMKAARKHQRAREALDMAGRLAREALEAIPEPK